MKLVRLFVFLLVLLPNLFSASTLLAQTATAPCDGDPNLRQENGLCFPTGTGLSETPLADVIKNFMFWLLGIFGFLAIIAFLISGIQYLTAAGNDKQIETAKHNMQYSIIGVIVALSGLVIIVAIEQALSGSATY